MEARHKSNYAIIQDIARVFLEEASTAYDTA
jgi:hypothetical protein